QFWGLEVGTEAFAVTLSFGGRNERITIPFEAITAFADPSVRFGLRFEGDTGESEGDENISESDRAEPGKAEIVGAKGAEVEAARNEPGAKVVTLENFRKK